MKTFLNTLFTCCGVLFLVGATFTPLFCVGIPNEVEINPHLFAGLIFMVFVLLNVAGYCCLTTRIR